MKRYIALAIAFIFIMFSFTGDINISAVNGSSADQDVQLSTSTSEHTTTTVAESEVTTTTATKSDSGLELNINKGNTWESGGLFYAQFDCSLKNNNDFSVRDWQVEIPVPDNSQFEQGWNGEFTHTGNNLHITSVTHNEVIDANSSADFGIIIATSDADFFPESPIVNGKKQVGNGENNSDNASGNTASNDGSGNNADSGSNTNNSDNDKSKDDKKPSANAPSKYKPNKGAVSGDDWLSVKGNKIVDRNGKEVWLTGVNWFGYNTGTNCFDGLWACHLEDSLQSIADHGFNLLRVPFSAELIKEWSNGKYPDANFNQAINSGLVGMNSLEIFDHVVSTCQSIGLKIMIDIHSANSDPMGHMEPMWYSSKITTNDYYNALAWMSKRYKDDDTIIAYDLCNEPHGKPHESPRAVWNNTKSEDNWKYVAEKAAMKVLEQNPNVLIMVEGIEIYPKDIKKNSSFSSTNAGDYHFNWWGGNLRGVKDYPINLGKYQNKLVYSPHDYGPAVYEQPWFKAGYNYDSLMKDCWRDNWFFIYEKKTAPLLIGEWGGFMQEPNLTWMKHMRKLIKTHKLHHTFWCFNQNSGDTGGLILDDWQTWDNEKYNFVKEVLWQKDGKFVGLDHKVPLGRNGIALK